MSLLDLDFMDIKSLGSGLDIQFVAVRLTLYSDKDFRP